MKKIFLLSLFLLIIFISPVLSSLNIMTYPVTDGFSVSSGDSLVELCRCESVVEELIVHNTGQFASIFTIALSESELVSLSESSFELMPDETRVIYMFFKAPCYKDLKETVLFEVSDIFQNKHVFEKELVVGRCQNLQASLVVDADIPLEPCSPVVYEVIVDNIGVFTETYHVSFGNDELADFFGTPFQSIIIPAGKSGVASSALQFSCDVSGDIIVPFTVVSEQSGLQANLEHILSIDPAYDFTVSLDAPVTVCRDDWDELFITLENNAPFTNSFSLEVSGPDFFVLEESFISLESGEQKVVQLFAEPTDDSLGIYDFSVTITDSTAGWTQSLSSNVSLVDCFGLSINFDLQEDIVDCAGYREYPIIIENTGIFDEDIVLSINGSSFVSLEENEFSLEAQSTVSTALIVDVPFSESVDSLITISAVVDGVSVFAEDSVHLSLLNEYACYQPILSPMDVNEKVSVQELEFYVKNSGLSQAAYDVRFESVSWLSLAAEDDHISLNPGESAAVTLLLYQDESEVLFHYDGIFKIFTPSLDGDVVLEYWFPVSIDLHGKSFFEKVYDYFIVHPCQFGSFLLLLFIIAGILILLARHSENRIFVKGVLPALLLLWVIALIIFLSVQGVVSLYDPVVQDPDDILSVRIAEDTSFLLNISSFFVDLDGDSLDFLVSDIDNVSITVINGSALFVPDADWSGTRRFRITAFDGNGGMTESPRMALEIVDRPEYSAWDLYVRYCGLVNIALLLVLVFLINGLAMVIKKPLPLVVKQQKLKRKKSKKKD